MFNTLARKLLGTMILLIFLCSALLALISFIKLQDAMISQMKNDGTTLVTTLRREIKNYSMNNLNQMQSIFQELKNESQGNIVYISITDLNLNMLVSDTQKAGTDSSNKSSAASGVDTVSSATTQAGDISEAVTGDKISGFIFDQPNGEKVYNVSAPYSIGADFKGTLNIGISLKGMYDQISRTLFDILLITLGIILITVILGTFITNTVTKPIAGIVRKLDDFEKGDFTIEFECKSKDDIGKLTNAMNRSVAVLKDTIGAVKNTGIELQQEAESLAKSSDEAAASSEEINQGIDEVANVIDVQNTNISEIVNTLGLFGHKMDNMLADADNVLQGNVKIKDTANLGYDSLTNLVQSIDDVRTAYNVSIEEITSLQNNIIKINEITEVINSVAAQTNLLALNAAIEAARAGEAGRGFSVVADEIRKLADQVMNSSGNINELVKGIETSANAVVESSESISIKMDSQVGVAGETVKSCNDIIVEVDKIIGQVQNVSSSLKEVRDDKDDIIAKVEEISETSNRISGTAVQIASSVQEQSASMQELSALAQTLNNMAEELKNNVSNFKI